MKIELPLPEMIQVRNVTNYKGNDCVAVTLDGQEVFSFYGHVDDEEITAEGFRFAFVRMFREYVENNAEYLLEPFKGREMEHDRGPDRESWETIRYVREED